MPKRVATHRPTSALPAARPAAERRPDRIDNNRFTSSTRWRKLRALVLAESPLCVDCLAEGRAELAREVHHKISRRERPDLAFDAANLAGLCKPHHSRRTARGE